MKVSAKFKNYFLKILNNFYKNVRKKEIRQKTLETYISRFSNIYQLLDKVEVFDKRPHFFNDVSNVMDAINKKYKKKLSSINTSISAILILLQALKFDEKVIQEYRNILFKNTDKKVKNKKEKLEEEGELVFNKKILNKMKRTYDSKVKLIDVNDVETNEIIFLQRYVLFYLYSVQPPVRLDYYIMLKTSDEKETYNKAFNYFYKNKFIFNNYKTNRIYGRVVLPIEKPVLKVLEKYKNFIGNSEYLFINPRTTRPYTSSQMSKLVIESFNGIGGVTEMRKYFASQQFQEIFKIQKRLLDSSKSMLNSPNVLKSNYIQLLKEDLDQ